MKTLFEEASILSYGKDGFSVIENGYLGIENDLIVYLSENEPKAGYDVNKNMSGKLLSPSLINGHGHSPMTLLRGLGSNLPLERWLKEAIWPIENRLDAQSVRVGASLAIMEMIAAGTTCFSDMYYMNEGTIEEICNAKVKSNQTCPILSSDPEESLLENRTYREFKSLYDNFDGYDNGRILIDFSIHAEYTVTEKMTREYARLCNESDGHMHIHLSETSKEHQGCRKRYGKTPTEWFLAAGLFDSSCQAAHCVVVEDGDIDILAVKGVSVVHNPTSNLKLGSGFAPIPTLLERGINVSLGTDGAASNNNLNMFEEMHIASIIHKGYHSNPATMNPEALVEMATVNAAKMMRRGDIGTLEVGKKADIIAIELDRPHLIPNVDLLSLMVYSMQASDVVMTMADGEIIYENGDFYTIDSEKVRFEVKNVMKKLY